MGVFQPRGAAVIEVGVVSAPEPAGSDDSVNGRRSAGTIPGSAEEEAMNSFFMFVAKGKCRQVP